MSSCWKSVPATGMRCWPSSPLASWERSGQGRRRGRPEDFVKRPDRPGRAVRAQDLADLPDVRPFLRRADVLIAVKGRAQQVCRLVDVPGARMGHGLVGQEGYAVALEDFRC